MDLQSTKNVCVDAAKACPAEEPVDSNLKWTKCSACGAVVDDITMLLTRSDTSTPELKKARLADLIDNVCTEMTWRHAPRPASKNDNSKLVELCDNMIGDYDEDIVSALVNLQELESPRNKICRKVTKSCKNKEEL